MATLPFDRTGRPRHPDVLTPAEWEVLAGVREGLSNRQIAERRGCDLETVRFHLRNLRRKLSLESREELRAFPGRPAAAIERARSLPRARRIREQIPLVETRDMGRALAFYVDTLGFEIVSRWPDEDEPGWVALASGGARLMLRCDLRRRGADGRSPHRGGHVVPNFYVEDVDGFRRLLERSGHACSETRSLFYGAREFDLRDPDGNPLVFVEFAASEPAYLAGADENAGAGEADPGRNGRAKSGVRRTPPERRNPCRHRSSPT